MIPFKNSLLTTNTTEDFIDAIGQTKYNENPGKYRRTLRSLWFKRIEPLNLQSQIMEGDITMAENDINKQTNNMLGQAGTQVSAEQAPPELTGEKQSYLDFLSGGFDTTTAEGKDTLNLLNSLSLQDLRNLAEDTTTTSDIPVLESDIPESGLRSSAPRAAGGLEGAIVNPALNRQLDTSPGIDKRGTTAYGTPIVMGAYPGKPYLRSTETTAPVPQPKPTTQTVTPPGAPEVEEQSFLPTNMEGVFVASNKTGGLSDIVMDNLKKLGIKTQDTGLTKQT